MRSRRLTVLCLLAIPATGQALAEAVTYRGTVGDRPVILEIAAPPAAGGLAFARFAFMAGGTDVPLNGVPADAGMLRFEEEARCRQDTCVTGDDGVIADVPVAAIWNLSQEGEILSGTRRDAASGVMVAARFERYAARPIDGTAATPLQALAPEDSFIEAPQPWVLHPTDLPYDFLKMDWPFSPGEERRVGDVVWRMDTDERTGIVFPVVTTLGGPDTGPVNAYLLQQRLQASIDAFSCRSQAYASFSWDSQPEVAEGEGGQSDDGVETGADGPDQPSVVVEHVSPRLIALSQSNSFYCGGAHPNNYTRHYLADARTGAAIVPERLLAGWIATGRDGDAVDPATYDNVDDSLTYGPSEELLAYVRSRRERFEDESCGYDDLIADRYHFGVHVTQDALVFTPRDLPHAIFACTEDLLTVPLAEARELLTEEAAGYFAVLDR